MANAFNFKVDKTKFENIEFAEWKRLVQFVLNYDACLSSIEKLDEQYLLKAQLEAYISARGTIPSQYVDIVNQLNEKYAEAKKIRQEIEISELDAGFKLKDQEEKLKQIEQELASKVIDKGKVIKARKAILFFQNPYFIDGPDQMFVKRLPALKQELKSIEHLIKKDLKPKLKKNRRMLGLIEMEFRRVLNIKEDSENKDFLPLFNFVRPHIDEIVRSETFYFSELLSLALED